MSNKSLTVVRQIQFDSIFCTEIKRLGTLASPGSNVTFENTEEALIVTFHGKEVQTRKRFNPTKAPFLFTMNGKDMLELMSTFAKSNLTTMTVKDNSISFRAGNTKMNRGIMANEPAPMFPDFENKKLITLPQNAIWGASFVAYAAAKASEEDATERVSVLLDKHMVSIVATNGCMAACVELECDYNGEAMEFLLHPRIINPLVPLTMRTEASSVEIGCNDRKYLIRFGEYEMAIAIPMTPSRRSAVMSAKKIAELPHLTAKTNAADFKLFLERSKLLDTGSPLVQPILLKLDKENRVLLARHSSAIGDIQDSFEAQVEGNLLATTFGMSPKYLTEVCSHLNSDTLSLETYGALLPVIVNEAIEGGMVTHILLPVRTSQKEVNDNVVAQSEEEAPDVEIITPSVSPDDFE